MDPSRPGIPALGITGFRTLSGSTPEGKAYLAKARELFGTGQLTRAGSGLARSGSGLARSGSGLARSGSGVARSGSKSLARSGSGALARSSSR